MTDLKKTTVLLADDNALVRRGLRGLLNANQHITVVSEARNGREAVMMARFLHPDIILMDISMPVVNGLEATRLIREADPTAKVILVSAHSDDEYVERALAAGMAGFVDKRTYFETLIDAIREVSKGNIYFSPSIMKRPHSKLHWPHFHKFESKPKSGRLLLSRS